MVGEFNKSGIVILNKEAGISSNTAVNKVKRILKAKKAGHLGTLDVLGEGVLPVTLNKATRLFDYFLNKDKTYRAIFVFGFETSTLDCEGEITNIDYRLVSEFEIMNSLKKFKGKIKQVPPQYSALKVGGRTAYDLARKGEKVELKEREIEIYDFKLIKEIRLEEKNKLIDRFLKFHNDELLKNHLINDSFKNNVFEFEITCSSGTYIRALCRDLAKELSTCGTMLSIVRTKCGIFYIKDSFTLEDINNGKFKVIDVENTIDLPSINIEEDKGLDVLNGKEIKIFPIQKNSFKLYCNDVFFGIANNKNNGIIKIETFLKANFN